ncbi:MAG: HD domain-containing protein [Planctomycetota bacterium]|nr:MAG: HD domain-containing protein [Planctomycetota bacterium]
MRAVGMGGLLHDIGMLRVPLSIRQAARPLTEREWHEVRRHPLHSLDMLASVRGLPQLVKMIVYQVHERSDGSGYPRGRRDAHLHQLSKIVGVADAYAAMTRERPYRPAMAPYEAARTILYEGAQGRFDRSIVRAMLDTVSLFPIGSRVVLSNGAAARVLRAVPGLHTRPVVEELGGDGSPTGHIIELAQNDHLRIVSAG